MKTGKKTLAKVAPILLIATPAGPFLLGTQPGGLNAATPGVEDTRNSQRAPSPPPPPLYFFLPLFFSPPSSLLLHLFFFFFFASTYNQRAHRRQTRRGEVRSGRGAWGRGGGGGRERDNFIALVSSARLHRGEELPRATLRGHWRIIVRGGGGGWATLSFSLLFLFLCGGNRDEWWASWGGFRPAESCAPCLCQELSTSGKNSIPRLKGMTRSSGPYSAGRPGNFLLFQPRARTCHQPPSPSPRRIFAQKSGSHLVSWFKW